MNETKRQCPKHVLELHSEEPFGLKDTLLYFALCISYVSPEREHAFVIIRALPCTWPEK